MKYSGSEIKIGFDIGSTTVKGVVWDEKDQKILWADYQRHETKQREKVYEFLTRIENKFSNLSDRSVPLFFTGSGGINIASQIGGKFVQEVNAVCLTVEKFHPDVGSVIELGGQDAKIIVWQVDKNTGIKQKIPCMNTKCAGGTGAIIDKIVDKLHVSHEELSKISFYNTRLHTVAEKCGVFAETDINGLQKQGVPSNELMASLFEAIVQQNLSTLAGGDLFLGKVYLLGGPNIFIPAMVEAWKVNIHKIWEESKNGHNEKNFEDLIVVPENAQYYGAIGSIFYGLEDYDNRHIYKCKEILRTYTEEGTRECISINADKGLVNSQEELKQFKFKYSVRPAPFPFFRNGEKVEAWLGIDGGSTSTKGALLNAKGDLLGRSYLLSKGNPVTDAIEIISDLRGMIEKDGAKLVIKGFGVTGYAKEIIKKALGADVALVETIAHTHAALHYYKDVDVIADVGGQDIKVIFLKNGIVKDFKLNTQCSAGNGYFLQSTASRFGVKVEKFSDAAFAARKTPIFNYGCAVFLESDIVNFQRLGWRQEEIMAGLARVLPKNIWLYVVQKPNLKKYGTKFILQGGTQKNLAAVKSQIDYIKERVPGAVVKIHQFCGESGAIGCALEALRITRANGITKFIGFNDVVDLTLNAIRDESTRCYYCKNKCLRTIIETKTRKEKLSKFIIANCEKGSATNEESLGIICAKIKERSKAYPNLVSYAAKRVFESFNPHLVEERDKENSETKKNPILKFLEKKGSFKNKIRKCADVAIGMPRVLAMYSIAPFFTAYFESLGVKNILWSDYTSQKMYKNGSKRGACDHCFPSKLGIVHVDNLLSRKNVDIIFFPTLINLKNPLKYTLSSWTCPTVQITPGVCKATFTKDRDLFSEKGVIFLNNPLHMNEPSLLERQMYDAFRKILHLNSDDNKFAIQEGWAALEKYKRDIVSRGRKALDKLTANNDVGIVLLGRPYHNDPGINHGITYELQQRGYPIFSMESLPDSRGELSGLFENDILKGHIRHPKDISDVFGNAYNVNSSYKIWTAKYAARHPNLAVIDLSSFKCGHDAPIYHIIEGILEATQTPYFTFHDIDENRPASSIKMRVETIDYTLKQYAMELKGKSHTLKTSLNENRLKVSVPQLLPQTAIL